MEMVKRQYAAEVRSESSDDSVPVVAGHAAVFDERTLIGSRRWGFVELIAPGAFDDVLGDDVRYLENHGGLPFARTKSGTLELSVTARGLHQRAEFDARNTAAMNHYYSIDRGDMDQMSFAFTILDDDVRQLPDDDPDFPGMVERTIKKIGRLYDVSGVTYPAYEGADVGVRSLFDARDQENQEREIRSLHERAGVEIPSADAEPNSDTPDEGRTEVSNETDVPMSAERAKALAAASRRSITKEIQ